MVSKILFGSGILMMVGSVLGVGWGIYSSFQHLKDNEASGIGAVGSSLEFALWSNIFFFVGLVLVVIGGVTLYRKKKAEGRIKTAKD